jgi:hypothetical protein
VALSRNLFRPVASLPGPWGERRRTTLDAMTYTGSGEPAVSAPPPGPSYPPLPEGQHYGPPPGPSAYGPPVYGPPVYGPPAVPEPPRGPGVGIPFPVPPTEGRSSRVWVGLGIGALVAVLACGGGIAAIIGLATTGSRALGEQAEVVVGDYFQAVQQKRYDDAYEQLCEKAQDDETADEFNRRLVGEPAIADYDIGDTSVSAIDPVVSVDVVYVDTTADTLRVYLVQDSSTGRFEVCGVEG